MEQKVIHALDGGRILAEYGPMRLVISAWVGKLPQRNLCVSAAREAFACFERVAAFKHELSRHLSQNPVPLSDPLARQMLESVRAVGDRDLTPLAAVAGTLADAVADFLFDRGMTRVVVNNGGDVAVRLIGDEHVNVGIGSGPSHGPVSTTIVLDSSLSSWGIATSGLGGRSFTRGVASAVTILAGTASQADAAATSVANASLVDDEEVVQEPAENIDPNTDMAGIPVTVRVGPLSEEKKETAVSRALEKAHLLAHRGLILGALVEVQGRIGADGFDLARLIRPVTGKDSMEKRSSGDEEGEKNHGSQKVRHSPGRNPL